MDGRANALGEHATLVRTRGIVIQMVGQMVSNIYSLFSPLFGEDSQLDEHIFQIGLSHQLDHICFGLCIFFWRNKIQVLHPSIKNM